MHRDTVLPKDRADRDTKTLTYIDPLLLYQRILLVDDTLYILYPMWYTYCSLHPEQVPKKGRSVPNIMKHLCSGDHIDRVQLLPGGREAREVGEIVSICEKCQTIPMDIAAHFREVHKESLYKSRPENSHIEAIDIALIERNSFLHNEDILSVIRP